ncbi:hypothetical protein EFQ99_05120 [Rhizobium vallis]|uniref:Uncharacterized protein n=1 Tax=Rhizobium vallis TaxID=634290 RepID=A0A432PSQ9_9HYPH|nr:hypothetical protein EFQ99_05120 [Rhizobium vallis]
MISALDEWTICFPSAMADAGHLPTPGSPAELPAVHQSIAAVEAVLVEVKDGEPSVYEARGLLTH